MTFNKEELKNKIIYRSQYRGSKELDLLMSSFVKSIINDIGIDDLLKLKELVNLGDENLMDIQQQESLRVLTIGDSCVDIYHYGVCNRLSPEAPVPILKLSYTEQKDGMAFNVKNNLESFNIKVDILTNQEVITKERYIDIRTKSHLLRCDTGEINKLQPISAEKVKDVQFDSYDAVSIVDYNKGFIDKSIAEFKLSGITKFNVEFLTNDFELDNGPIIFS